MKRLKRINKNEVEAPTENKPKKMKCEEPSNKAKNFLKIVADRQEAIDKKIKRLEGSFFGKPVNELILGEERDVWVPYGYFVYKYEVGSKLGGLLKMGKRTGKVHIIYDMNERHCFQYDEKESGELPIVRGNVPTDSGDIIKLKISKNDIKTDVEDYIQYKIMYKTFGCKADLTLEENIIFYRPAVELEVFFRGKNRNLRYAYLDEYAVENEHILGMKYRLKH